MAYKVLFSDYFNVDKTIISEYGAVNISLFADTPLFIDPLLVFNNEDPEIKCLYEKISSYLKFLNKIASNNPSEDEIQYYFRFKEVKENWLGVSKIGNRGNALGDAFANELVASIGGVCDDNGITNDVHIEKMYLVKRGVGKDKISDWTTNLLLGFFADYTERFAKKYIEPSKCKTFEVRKYSFNYEIEQFVAKDVYLPFIKNKDGKDEYVLLTPKSILRRDEQEISFGRFQDTFDVFKTTIPNAELRLQINKLYRSEKKKIYDKRFEEDNLVTNADIKKFEKDFFELAIAKFPQLYDYFIKIKEGDSSEAIASAKIEVENVLQTINDNEIATSDVFGFSILKEKKTAYDEALFRLNYMKNQIEHNGLWRALYINNEPIRQEDLFQRLFALTWCRSHYRFSPESNCGAGPVDFLISCGFEDATVIEFKLASNNKLTHVFKQVEEYKISHRTAEKSIVAIFYFNDSEKEKAISVSNSADKEKYTILLIDCDKDTKSSASNK